MINSRKRIIADILMIEKQLKHQKTKLLEHKNAIQKVASIDTLVLVFTLLPAFITGWKVARIGDKKHSIKRLLKFGLLTTITNLRKIAP